ncbi:MAG: hypothetical protein HQL53_03595, partial [Magnetococcales bacterium]|nr:hypothetical protein [Magnetococcales bacterium]
PMVERHLERQKERLTPQQRHAHLCESVFYFAGVLFSEGYYRESLPLFVRSLRLGHRPVKCLLHLIRALLRAPMQQLGGPPVDPGRGKRAPSAP